MMQNGVQYASTRLSELINVMKKNKLLTCGHECCYKVPYDFKRSDLHLCKYETKRFYVSVLSLL